MSKGPENTFIASVSKHVPASVYRMKNHNAYVGGVPDMWYSGVGGDLWVEYKFIEVPKSGATLIDLTSGKRPDLSALQQHWLRARCLEGRQVGVIIGSKLGGVWLPGVTWDCAISTAEFLYTLRTRAELAQVIEASCRG